MGNINKTHSLQTESPYRHTAAWMYHVFVFTEPQSLPAQRRLLWSCFLTESFLFQRAVLWSTEAQSQIIRPSCRSGRMASLYVWGAWWEKQCRVWSSLSVTFARTQLLSEKHIWLKLFSHINSGKHRVNQVGTFSEVVLSHIYKEMVQISCILINRSSQSEWSQQHSDLNLRSF